MTDSTKKIALPLASSQDVSQPRTRAEGGDIMSEIAREVADNRVVLYLKGTPDQPMCGFSARASAILNHYGASFHAVNILADHEKREAIKVFSNWPTIPQCYVGGEFIGGCDILMEMHEAGELKDLLVAT